MAISTQVVKSWIDIKVPFIRLIQSLQNIQTDTKPQSKNSPFYKYTCKYYLSSYVLKVYSNNL